MKELTQNTGQWFNCGCREWKIDRSDDTGITEQPDKTFTAHTCSKIIVYQQNRGVKRYFRKV